MYEGQVESTQITEEARATLQRQGLSVGQRRSHTGRRHFTLGLVTGPFTKGPLMALFASREVNERQMLAANQRHWDDLPFGLKRGWMAKLPKKTVTAKFFRARVIPRSIYEHYRKVTVGACKAFTAPKKTTWFTGPHSPTQTLGTPNKPTTHPPPQERKSI